MEEEWKEASVIHISFKEQIMPGAIRSEEYQDHWLLPKEPFYFVENHNIGIQNYRHKGCLYYIDRYFGLGQAALKIRYKDYYKKDAQFVEYIFPFHEITGVEIIKCDDDES